MDEDQRKQDRRGTALRFKTPWGEVELRGFNALLFGLFVVNSLGVYVLWDHKNDAAHTEKNLSVALREVANSQREFACIISKEGEARTRAFETGECRRFARIGSFGGND
jgi:hypothetical protein